MDTDGDVIVKDNYRCYLRPDPDGRLISVYAIFGCQPNASQADKLAYVNRVNDQVKLIRASVSSNGKFFFDYYISVEGGVSRRSIVMSVRRFFSCLGSGPPRGLRQRRRVARPSQVDRRAASRRARRFRFTARALARLRACLHSAPHGAHATSSPTFAPA